MKVSILCSDAQHPVYSYLEEWKYTNEKYNDIELVTAKELIKGGDVLFLISCQEIIDIDIRRLYKKVLVIHASDLPSGRGWSPHVWQILEGKSEITISLLEAGDKVDSGDIWKKLKIHVQPHELFDEINDKIFNAEIELMSFAVKNFYHVKPVKQDHSKATYYSKRKPEDSKIDPNSTISEQFDLLRVSDTDRYPAYFEHRGYCYSLIIKKVKKLTEKV